jgi:hypothetical protein
MSSTDRSNNAVIGSSAPGGIEKCAKPRLASRTTFPRSVNARRPSARVVADLAPPLRNRWFADSPLEEGVSSEPVSAWRFPGNREKCRELRCFRPRRRRSAPKTQPISVTCKAIPWTMEQGIFSARSGKAHQAIAAIREFALHYGLDCFRCESSRSASIPH